MTQHKRFLHVLPGRIRVEVFGLKYDPQLLWELHYELSRLPGVLKVSGSPFTGRILIHFNEGEIAPEQLLNLIYCFESSVKFPSSGSGESPVLGDDASVLSPPSYKNFAGGQMPAVPVQLEVAAAAEASQSPPLIPFSSLSLQANPPGQKASPLPLPLVLTAGGLGVLGLKRIFAGRSALARSPGAFQIAALWSLISGYPKIRQEFGRLLPKRSNPDLILGAGALALALARENLVVLAGLGLMEWLKWRQSQELDRNSSAAHRLQSPEIKAYSEKAGPMNFLIAGTAWAITGSPYIGLAALLAGNPRVASLPAEYIWNQADLTIHRQGHYIPEQMTLPELAHVKTVVLEDASLLVEPASEEIQWQGNSQSNGSEDAEGEAWHYAASLMRKANHPWLDEVLPQAERYKGRIRAAFKVNSTQQGLSATVHGSEILLGSLKFLQENGVDCDPYLIEVKRAARHGFDVECLAKDKTYLGCLKKFRGQVNSSLVDTLSELRKANVRIGYLMNQKHLASELLSEFHLEEFQPDILNATSTPANMPESIGEYEPAISPEAQILNRMNQGIVLISSGNNFSADECESVYISENADCFPRVPVDQLSNFYKAVLYARRVEELNLRHFRIARVWNVLGTALGVTSVLTAPVVNLIGDSLSLLFMAHGKRFCEDHATESAKPFLELFPTQSQSRGTEQTPSTSSSRLNMLAASRASAPPPLAAASDTALSGIITNPPWHNLDPALLLSQFGVNDQHGLSPEAVQALQHQYGLNQLERKKPISWFQTYLGQFKEFTTLVVLGTTLFAFLTGDIFDGLAMGSILLLNAGVGTAQERKAEKVIDALNEYHPPLCKVLREGSTQEIDGSMLVPGDIVVLEAGDRVPADLRLLKVWNLEANETALTGESLPVPKQTQLLSSDCPLAERSNMLYMGTDITRGKGIGLVVGTGMNTEIGYLMSLMKGQENLATPLHERVTGISKKFVKYAAIAGGIVFIVGFLRGNPLTQLVGTSITLAASAVPEGLPITITIALSAGIARMAKKNAVVRKMSAIETLGRTTVICTDKTGTLTKNEMTVKRIATLTKAWDVSGDGYEPQGELHLLYKNEVAATELSIGTEDPELQKIVRIGLLCNNSELLENEGNWSIKGDPTEGTLLSLAGKLSHQPEEIKRWQRVHEVPFDSNSGTMTVVCRDHNQEQDQECFIFCKGSVESILSRSRWVQVNGEVRPLTAEAKAIILEQNLQLAEEALRVLGFAYCPTKWLEGQPPQLDDELIYVGLTGMMDPPKPEAEQSIREADALGIKTVMITGDHPATAIAIAQRLGFGERARQVLTGIELDQLSQEILIDRIEDIAIFARVTPEHKLRIVQAFQARGHVVAMTGDGVNDTPAIKQANVGIAMGRNGTEVAKATADMVLLQDGFDTILAGVKEGRTIIGNIRKAIGCLLTGNLAEILVTATAVIIGLPMPLVPIQILLMNLLTDAIPAMILAINPGAQDGDNAAAPPRQDVVDRQLYQKVITRGILLGAASLTLFAVTLGSGVPLPVAQTVAFTTLVMGQFAQTLSWRKEGSTPTQPAVKDRYLLLGMGGSLLALLGTLYIPSLSRFFHTAPLGASHWVAVLLIASLVSLVSKPFLYWMTSKSPLLSSASPKLLQTQPEFQVA